MFPSNSTSNTYVCRYTNVSNRKSNLFEKNNVESKMKNDLRTVPVPYPVASIYQILLFLIKLRYRTSTVGTEKIEYYYRTSTTVRYRYYLLRKRSDWNADRGFVVLLFLFYFFHLKISSLSLSTDLSRDRQRDRERLRSRMYVKNVRKYIYCCNGTVLVLFIF